MPKVLMNSMSREGLPQQKISSLPYKPAKYVDCTLRLRSSKPDGIMGQLILALKRNSYQLSVYKILRSVRIFYGPDLLPLMASKTHPAKRQYALFSIKEMQLRIKELSDKYQIPLLPTTLPQEVSDFEDYESQDSPPQEEEGLDLGLDLDL